MDDLTRLALAYLTLIEAGVPTAIGPMDRSYFAERLSAAGEIVESLRVGDLGRAAGIANGESRSIGWESFPGPSGANIHDALLWVHAAIQMARLRGALDE